MISSFPSFSELTQAQLDTWVNQARERAQEGQLPTYIPLLGQAETDWLAVHLQSVSGAVLESGNTNQPFCLMSVVKPFVLLFLLEQLGADRVFSLVGTQPSEHPFHSLTQLTLDGGFPRNPMINSGAIALAGHLPGDDGATRCEQLRQWLNQKAGCHLLLDQAMLASVRSLKNEANREIADLLAEMGHLNEIETTLDTYNQICCLSGTVGDLAKLGLLLASPQAGINLVHRRMVNALMLTCGLYEASASYAVRIGLPIKSGVSGALLAVAPSVGAIACYSPALDATGNSVAALFLVEQIAQTLNLSLFS